MSASARPPEPPADNPSIRRRTASFARSAANRLGGLAGDRATAGRLDVDRMLAAARKEAGLHDFGDGSFRDGLDALVGSLARDASLTPVGASAMRRMVIELLIGRLRLRDAVKKSELVEYEVVPPPVVVVGLPGSGVEVLHGLLAHDPLVRSVRGWEVDAPVPPVRLGERASDPRLVAAIRAQLSATTAPLRHGMHTAGPADPADDSGLLATSFAARHFETLAPVSGYGDWLDDADVVPALADHRTRLALLQTTVPVERWCLASSAHLWHLDALCAAYPQARIVWLHRDPARTVPVLVDQVVRRHRQVSDRVDPERIAARWTTSCHRAVTAAASAADQLSPDDLFHLQYAELVEDPVGSVERIYRHFGLALPDVGRRRMQVWQEDHPTRLAPAPGSVTVDDDLRDRFAEYRSRFVVPTEPPPTGA